MIQERLDEIEQRLETINTLKRKFGGSLDEILQKKKGFEEELAGLLCLDDEIKEVSAKLSELKRNWPKKLQCFHKERKKSATALELSIQMEIRELRMADSEFEIRFHTHG